MYISSLWNLPPTSHPIPPLQGCHRAPDVSSLFHTADSHWLSILHMVMYFNAALPVRPTLSFPYCVHKSVLYVCVSVTALQIGSSAPSLYIPYICVNIQYLFSLTTSLCIIGSTFFHHIRSNSNAFLFMAYYNTAF